MRVIWERRGRNCVWQKNETIMRSFLCYFCVESNVLLFWIGTVVTLSNVHAAVKLTGFYATVITLYIHIYQSDRHWSVLHWDAIINTHICRAEFHFLFFWIHNGMLFHVGNCLTCSQNLRYKGRMGNQFNATILLKKSAHIELLTKWMMWHN